MSPLASRKILDHGREPDCETASHSHDLAHPESGLANDYLNIFNELIMLVEQLPSMPEFMDDIQRWEPLSYVEYFQRSSLPGSQAALVTYRGLDPAFRNSFEDLTRSIDRAALQVVNELRKHQGRFGDGYPRGLETLCLQASATLRGLLSQAAAMVNREQAAGYEKAQQRVDRLLADHLKNRRD